MFDRILLGRKSPPLICFMIFGQTDLSKGISGAKFDAEANVEAFLPLAPMKPNENSKNERVSLFSRNNFFGLPKE